MYSQQHLLVPQQQPEPPQPPQRRRLSLTEPVVVVPLNVPTKLNNTTASIPLLRPQEPGGPLPIDYVPTNLDVCSGRGKRNWTHSGNVAFRDLIQHSTPAYMAAATKNEKTSIVCNIVEEMRSIGCKFLKQDSKTGCWYDIGDAQAREKVGHSLRDQVTAFNRSNTTSNPEDGDSQASHLPHHQRTLSDSGKEADVRRMSLDTTELFGQFARRPSWIAQSENDTCMATEASQLAKASPSMEAITETSTIPSQNQIEAIINGDKETASLVNDTVKEQTKVKVDTNVDGVSNASTAVAAAAPPAPKTPVAASLPYEARKYLHPTINEHAEFDSTNHSENEHTKEYEPVPRRYHPRESITMTDIQSWNSKADLNYSQVMDTASMLQDSVQSWDPRMSSTSSMMSVRRSIMNMAGSTTLRRLTNNFRASEISMQSIQSFIDGMDFDDDDDDYLDKNIDAEVFVTNKDDGKATDTR